MSDVRNPWHVAAVVCGLLAAMLALGLAVLGWGERLGLAPEQRGWMLLGGCVLILLGYAAVQMLVLLGLRLRHARWQGAGLHPPAETLRQHDHDGALCERLRQQEGPFWRRRTRLLLVVGEAAQIEGIAPGLVAQRWQVGGGLALIHGGLTATVTVTAHQLRQWHSLEAVVWVLSPEQALDTAQLQVGARQLQRLARQFGRALPLHLWELRTSASSSSANTDAAGVRWSHSPDPATVKADVQELNLPLLKAGLAQLRAEGSPAQDFFVGLSHDLKNAGAVRWHGAVRALHDTRCHATPLAGLWFSPALPPHAGIRPHDLQVYRAWDGIRQSPRLRKTCGPWRSPLTQRAVIAGSLLAAGVALGISYQGNHGLLITMHDTLDRLNAPSDHIARAYALADLAQVLDVLDSRASSTVPLHLRWGLSQQDALLAAGWPAYAKASHVQITTPLRRQLRAKLDSWLGMTMGPTRTEWLWTGLEPFKGYLMLARPAEAAPERLREMVAHILPGLDQLHAFHARQLPRHPEWAIPLDPKWLAQVRLAFIDELDGRAAVDRLFRHTLDTLAEPYPRRRLEQWLADQGLSGYTSDVSLDTRFTRAAWDVDVRDALVAVAREHRHTLDWLWQDPLPGGQQPPDTSAQLEARYFRNFELIWGQVLDGLQPPPPSFTVDPLESSLPGMMGVLRDQALTGSADGSVTRMPGLAPFAALWGGLETTPPLLSAFMAQQSRLALERVQANLVPGRRDLSDDTLLREAKGSAVQLISRLGSRWTALGYSLFMTPVDQIREQLVSPAMHSLDQRWQARIVQPWAEAFAARYPFKADGHDSSMTLLGQMIRTDSGRIERFLNQELQGIVRNRGGRWEAVDEHVLTVDVGFLQAINDLASLAERMFPQGSPGLAFELKGVASTGVVETRLMLDDRTLVYFNQKERWSTFHWPAQVEYPGAWLSWISDDGKSRRVMEHSGPWALFRWLESAHIDESGQGLGDLRLSIPTPEGPRLSWHLRAAQGEGPLAVLQLARQFEMPHQIFRPTPARSTP